MPDNLWRSVDSVGTRLELEKARLAPSASNDARSLGVPAEGFPSASLLSALATRWLVPSLLLGLWGCSAAPESEPLATINAQFSIAPAASQDDESPTDSTPSPNSAPSPNGARAQDSAAPDNSLDSQEAGAGCPAVSREMCNGLDDDCDGVVDESYLCQPAPSANGIDELLTHCPSAATLDAIDQDLDIRFEFEDANGDGSVDDPAPQGNQLICYATDGSRDLTQSQERVYQALIALRALEFSVPLPFTDLNLYEWLVSQVDGIRVSSSADASSCCSAPPEAKGHYITLRNTKDSSYFITDLWSDTWGLGMFNLVQLLVHEARHVEVHEHSCDSANDNTISEMGAWGAVYYFARALAFNSDACFLRPTLGASERYADQALNPDTYLSVALDYAHQVKDARFCEEPPSQAQPAESVTACAE